MRSLRSKSVTRWPALLGCAAAASPPGPDPTTAAVRPVRNVGGSGRTQPSSKARSMIACSICLIVTASSLMSRTHAASHGAGQIRPVNSGKLLVAWSASIASRQRSRYTRSFQSGMRLPSGQPEWQKGMPQSMQRAPCFWSSACGSSTTNSLKSSTRWGIGRFFGSCRSIFRKPPSSPIPGKHLLLGLLLDLGPLAVVGAGVARRLPGPLGRRRGVLLLAGLARLARLHPVAGGRVGLALPSAHRAGSVAVAVLGDHRGLASVDRGLLLALAQHALVVHRHDLDPGPGQRIPLRQDPLGNARRGALAMP